MTGLYLFAAAAGVPLVLWFVLAGGDDGAGADDAAGGFAVRWLPLSTFAFVAAAFGLCGLLLGVTGAGEVTRFVTSAIAGVVAGVLNSTLFAYLRRSESSSGVDDTQLAGRIGRVVVPVSGGGRGRIALTVGDQQIQLSAQGLPQEGEDLPVGAPVLVVEVHRGIASVTRLDPELN